jgi:protein arginine N-methyltransferase 1
VAKEFPGDAIVHCQARSTELDLPERVDLAVCDQIGGFVHDAGVLEFFADARRRHLTDGGRLLPASFRLYLAPARCEKIRTQINIWGSSPEGFDFEVFRKLAINSEYRIDGQDCQLLSPGVLVAEIQSDHETCIKGSGTTAVEGGLDFDGLVGWFEADFGSDVTLTNHPSDPNRMDRWCNFYPIDEQIDVDQGDMINIDVDIRPLLHAVTWKVEVRDRGGTSRLSERNSTLLGEFIAPDALKPPRSD